MYRQLSRLGLTCAIVLASLAVGAAQEQRAKDPDDYRRFFRKPETPLEYWKAIQFELDVGRADLAAGHIRGLLASKPGDAELLTIVDDVGLSPVLRLRTTRNWFKDDKQNEQALKDVAQLIRQITDANNRRLKNPERIRELIGQLSKTEEERVYALRELYKTGAAAVPALIEALGRASDSSDRLALIGALESMGPAAIGPMIAALDSDNARLKVDLLNILRKRHGRFAPQIVPHLWFPSANPDEARPVRQKARDTLAEFLDVPASRLTPAKTALAREAESFYQRQARLGDPKAVVVWRWDGKGVVQGWPGAPTITADQANEYWGLRFARQALALDPAYRPVQEVFLGLAIQSRAGREVDELVAKSSTELLVGLLERALKEQRRPELIKTIRALGDRAEVRAKRPGNLGDAALVRALYYPDPRVQLEAVQTLLLIPGPPAPKTAARIAEILGNQLAPASAQRPGRKVLVAVYHDEFRSKTGGAVLAAGGEPILVNNGRDAMRRLREQPGVDAILMDSTLPNPGLAQLLAQMRQDVDFGKVPVLLAALPQTRTAREAAACYAAIRSKLDRITAETRTYRSAQEQLSAEELEKRQEVAREKFVKVDERLEAERVMTDRYAQRRKELDQDFLDAVRLSRDVPRLEAKRDRLIARYDLESQLREDQLARFTARYPGVRVVHPSVFTDEKALSATLTAAVREADVALTQEQQGQSAEVAIQILANLAQGRPTGYDIRPVAERILGALRQGRLSPRGQIAAIDAAARLPGSRPQAELLNALMDGARPANVRTAAGEGLVQSMQRHGIQLTANQVAPLCDLAKDPKLDAGLKVQVGVVIGALRPGDKKTGERLRRYDPQPVAPVPPPKEEKKGEKD